MKFYCYITNNHIFLLFTSLWNIWNFSKGIRPKFHQIGLCSLEPNKDTRAAWLLAVWL